MYDNIGRKIMGLAKFLCIVGIILSIISGLSMIYIGAESYTAEYLIYVGVVEIILGPIVAWISSFVLYGFGDLVDRVRNIEASAHVKVSSNPYCKGGTDYTIYNRNAEVDEATKPIASETQFEV